MSTELIPVSIILMSRILQQFNYWDQNNKNYQIPTLVAHTEFFIKGNNSTPLH